MEKFDIFVDSGANIPDELVKKHGIGVIPYSCTVNGEERLCYDKDAPFVETAKRYYDDLRNGADVKTSLIGMDRIMQYITPSLESGRDVLIFTISSGISGTYNQAMNAKAELEKKYPERKVFVCDGANASMGMGLQALKVADLRDLGESAEECAKWAERNAYKFNSYFTVADLKYLRKGGRISATLAIAGTLLNIKPILRADGGTPAKISSFGKERGRKKALAALAQAYADNVDNVDYPVAICHADCEEDANELAELLKAKGAKDIIIEYYDLCTGSHVGPGTVALFFYGKDRRGEAAAAEKKTVGRTVSQKI